jgi:hypothetical protein
MDRAGELSVHRFLPSPAVTLAEIKTLTLTLVEAREIAAAGINSRQWRPVSPSPIVAQRNIRESRRVKPAGGVR